MKDGATCTVCGEFKARECFYWRRSGLPYTGCIACQYAKRNKTLAREHRTKFAAYQTSYEKQCSLCKKILPRTEFFKCGDHLSGPCKQCSVIRHREYMKTNAGKESKRLTGLKRRASMIIGSDKWWKTRFSKRYHSVGKTRVTMDWRGMMVMFRSNPYCRYCGISLEPNTVWFDHKMPHSRGGADSLDNLCPCCEHCNVLKGVMSELEFMSFLPTYIARFNRTHSAERWA